MIIATFPGTGKTIASLHLPNIVDMESSAFRWPNTGDRVETSKGSMQHPNPAFPDNYVKAILKYHRQGLTTLTSTHSEVLNTLRLHAPVTVIVPDPADKHTYLDRYSRRGNNAAMIDYMRRHWNTFLAPLLADPRTIVLRPGQNLTDVLPSLIRAPLGA